MDSRPGKSTKENDDNFVMIPVHQSQNYDDVMARRIKNRERQRRYRARKRLESDMKKAHNTNNFVPPYRQAEVNWSFNSGESRILCRRNWKQDARRVHMAKQQFTENVIQCESNFGDSIQENDIERRVVLGRRHWKADARNKKD